MTSSPHRGAAAARRGARAPATGTWRSSALPCTVGPVAAGFGCLGGIVFFVARLDDLLHGTVVGLGGAEEALRLFGVFDELGLVVDEVALVAELREPPRPVDEASMNAVMPRLMTIAVSTNACGSGSEISSGVDAVVEDGREPGMPLMR